MSQSKSMGPIPVRRQDFDFSNISNTWYKGDIAGSTIFNALSPLFPLGEKQFIDTVKYFRDEITDEDLKADIKGFIGQESHHGHQHENMNNALKGLGYDIDKMEDLVRGGIAFDRKVWSKYDQLATTCALEHFTAMLAHRFLELEHEGSDTEMLNAWTWHSLEETEHKSVAFDVLKTLNNPFEYPRRILAYLLSTFLLIIGGSINAAQMFHKDGVLFKLSTWAGIGKFLFGKQGMLRGMGSYYFAYFKPSFHPWQMDSSHLITDKVLDTANESSRVAKSKKNRDVIISHDGAVLS